MKTVLLMGVALAIASCSTSGEPEDEPWAHFEFVVTSQPSYSADTPDVQSMAKAQFYGNDGFVSPDSVQVNGQLLSELDDGVFSRSTPPVPDLPYAVRWSFKRFLGSDYDGVHQLPSVLHFLNANNGDTISSSKGAVLSHTGSSPSRLYVWIRSALPHQDTISLAFRQNNDGLLELDSSELSRLKPNAQYRLMISSEAFDVEQHGSAKMTFSLYSQAIVYFVLVE
jgi:hypothetical protein